MFSSGEKEHQCICLDCCSLRFESSSARRRVRRKLRYVSYCFVVSNGIWLTVNTPWQLHSINATKAQSTIENPVLTRFDIKTLQANLYSRDIIAVEFCSNILYKYELLTFRFRFRHGQIHKRLAFEQSKFLVSTFELDLISSNIGRKIRRKKIILVVIVSCKIFHQYWKIYQPFKHLALHFAAFKCLTLEMERMLNKKFHVLFNATEWPVSDSI